MFQQVAIETKKKRKVAPSAVVQSEKGAEKSAANQHDLGCPTSSGPNAARDTAAPGVPAYQQPLSEAVPVSAGSPQPVGTPIAVSPSTSESNFTLLPGYVSRPGPSPLKQPAQAPAPVISQGGFVAPSHVRFRDQTLAEAKKQGTEGPNSAGPAEGEDALWRELSEELKRARELPEMPASVPVAMNAALKDPAKEPVRKARRTRQAAKSTHSASRLKDGDPSADITKPAQSRLLAPVGTLTAAVRYHQPCHVLNVMIVAAHSIMCSSNPLSS